jgi:hypothetical protein
MPMAPLAPLPETYASTRDALHRLAVYVVSPAQRRVDGEIVLRATPGGFGTHSFGESRRVVRVDATDLVIDEAGAEQVRAPIVSLSAAAALVGTEPDLVQEQQFDVPPAGAVDEPLEIDPAAVAVLHAWYAFTEDVLGALRGEAGADDDPSPVRLWPEHFDAATDLGNEAAGRRATYGGSPGDRHHAEPYLYASPWAGRIDPFFDDPEFRGASLTYNRLLAEVDQRSAAMAFLRRARDLVQAAGG